MTITSIQGEAVPLARPGERLVFDADQGFVFNAMLSHPAPVGRLREAGRLREGAAVYVLRTRPDAAERAYEDRFGRLTRVRVSGGVLRGDIRFNPRHALAPVVLHDILTAPHRVALSMTRIAPVAFDLMRLSDPAPLEWLVRRLAELTPCPRS